MTCAIVVERDYDSTYIEMISQVFIFQEARRIARRSNCAKRRLGTVLVKNGVIISTGWNTCRCGGSPRNRKIKREDCLRIHLHNGKGYELAQAVHAEVSAILHIRKRRRAVDYEQCITTVVPTTTLIEKFLTEKERDLLRGATMYLSGHTYACDSCKQWCKLCGISDIIIEDGAA
ncbi:TPA: hypothetical protein DCL30_00435 [Candidatus Peribacteria bacterium]|nr:hypothetical protein [Candidatus Peribacteria bacterium]HAS34638.1 hypothetical protein [Candidatus Peribacteria bacterium]